MFKARPTIIVILMLVLLLSSCTSQTAQSSSKTATSKKKDTAVSSTVQSDNAPTYKDPSSDNSTSVNDSSVKPTSSTPSSSSNPQTVKPESDTDTDTDPNPDYDYEYEPDYNKPDKEPAAGGKVEPFTIAIYPDTQQEVVLENAVKNKHFLNRTQWLVDNADELNLKFVIHTGDVVNWGNEVPAQFDIASEAMAPLDKAKIPTFLCIGNHDTAAVGVGGSAADPSNTWVRVRNTSAFNAAFPTTRYPDFVPFEDGKIDNGFRLLSAGGYRWLVMTLELWPRDEVIDWANMVISDYPDYNVIIATHSYLTATGAIYTRSEYGKNSPEAIFDKLISQHKNIKMVFSGHAGAATHREDYGVYGNKIASFLGCFHSNDKNPVQLMKVDPANNSVYIRTYSPIDNSEWSQYNATIDDMDFIK